MLFPDPHAAFNPGLPVGLTLTEPLRVEEQLLVDEQAEGLVEAVRVVGLSPEILDRLPATFTAFDLQRLALARAAVDGVPGLVVDDREVRRGGPSYTIDTVDELRAEDPAIEVVVILGSDAAALLGTWERFDDLARTASFAVVERPGVPAAELPAGARSVAVAAPLLAVSSTEIRARAAAGKPVHGLVPAGAATLVEGLRLYRSPR